MSHKEKLKHKSHKENKLKHKSRTVIIIIIPAQSAQKHTARFEAIATELRAESAGNVRAMDLEAADELQTTPVREFARARIQEIYDTIATTVHHTRRCSRAPSSS